MRTVPVKTVNEQAATIVVKHREMLIGQRAQAINAVRGHTAEFGIAVAKGCASVAALVVVLAADAAIPPVARERFTQMGQHVIDLDIKIKALDQRLLVLHKTCPINQQLAATPGIGPITAITMALGMNSANFETERHFAAWLGLTHQERSTGRKHYLGKIGKADNERLRQLLAVGATAVVRCAKPGGKSAIAWLLQLLAPQPREVMAVTLTNKMDRAIWTKLANVPKTSVVGMPAESMMPRRKAYRRQPVAA